MEKWDKSYTFKSNYTFTKSLLAWKKKKNTVFIFFIIIIWHNSPPVSLLAKQQLGIITTAKSYTNKYNQDHTHNFWKTIRILSVGINMTEGAYLKQFLLLQYRE